MLLKNKTAVITGSNRGIGFSILELFSKNGANIIACIRKKDEDFENKVNRLSKQYKNTIDIILLNLEHEKEIEKAFNEIKDLNVKIDILINNAGINQISLFQMTSLEKIRSVFQINFFSAVSFTQKILKLISKNNYSKIINISSNAAKLNSPGRSAYASSKAALISFTKVLSKELGNTKICVNAIAPGLVETDMMKNTSQKIKDEILNNTPLKKAATPADVANVALFLSSNSSDHITGETIFVTGGYE